MAWSATVAIFENRILSDEDKDFFAAEGYLVLKNLYPKSVADQVACNLYQLIQSQHCVGVELEPAKEDEDPYQLLLEALFLLEASNHRYIQQIYDVIRDTNLLREMTSLPRLSQATCELLNLPINSPLYTRQCAARIDMPGDKDFSLDWHQEVHYTYKDSEMLQLWAPLLTDITAENGALQILPGSHTSGVAETTDHYPDFGVRQFTVIPEVIARYEPKEICLAQGDALLFSNKLIHKSGINSSQVPRLTLICQYHNATLANFSEQIQAESRLKKQNSYVEAQAIRKAG